MNFQCILHFQEMVYSYVRIFGRHQWNSIPRWKFDWLMVSWQSLEMHAWNFIIYMPGMIGCFIYDAWRFSHKNTSIYAMGSIESKYDIVLFYLSKWNQIRKTIFLTFEVKNNFFRNNSPHWFSSFKSNIVFGANAIFIFVRN